MNPEGGAGIAAFAARQQTDKIQRVALENNLFANVLGIQELRDSSRHRCNKSNVNTLLLSEH